MYCLFCVVLCIVFVYMCTEQLLPGGYPIAVKYIIYYQNGQDVKPIIYFQLVSKVRIGW